MALTEDGRLPIYCARCPAGGHATHHVDAPGRHEVVCEQHLAASLAWAGPKAVATPIEEAQGQAALFEMPPVVKGAGLR